MLKKGPTSTVVSDVIFIFNLNEIWQSDEIEKVSVVFVSLLIHLEIFLFFSK